MADASPRSKRVLVVDDEVKFCRLVAEFLRGRNYTVATASTLGEAVQQLERTSPDVVLLDLVMPGLAGFGLLKLIRSRAFPPRVIMVTATDTGETAEQALREGVEAYVCKPINLEVLDRLISGFWPPQSLPLDQP